MPGPALVRQLNPASGSKVVSIANGQSLSPIVDLGNNRLAAIQMPAAWTAAALTFQVSVDGTNFFSLFDKAAEYSVASASAGANQTITQLRADFLPFRYLKVRSGTSAAPVAQGAQRDLTLIVMP